MEKEDLRTGEIIVYALWLTKEELQGEEQDAKDFIKRAMADSAEEWGIVLGEPSWSHKSEGDDNIPPSPEKDATLLVAEAKVLMMVPDESRFATELSTKDLERLRKITRDNYFKHYPMLRLTDAQCDTIINEFGPDVAVATLRGEVDNVSKYLN